MFSLQGLTFGFNMLTMLTIIAHWASWQTRLVAWRAILPLGFTGLGGTLPEGSLWSTAADPQPVLSPDVGGSLLKVLLCVGPQLSTQMAKSSTFLLSRCVVMSEGRQFLNSSNNIS